MSGTPDDMAPEQREQAPILSAAETCKLRTWCIERDDHEGPCVEVPRAKNDAPDFGPRGRR